MALVSLPLPTPTTVLQAVNDLMALIRRAPVVSLEAAVMSVDAQMALQHIHTASIQVQESGWLWNTEYEFPLSPDPVTGKIAIPGNVLKIDPDGQSYGLDIVPRGEFLYDRDKKTYAIGKTVYVGMVMALKFEELPQAMRTYITIKAGRVFALGRIDLPSTSQFTANGEYAALVALEQAADQADDRTLQIKNPTLARKAWYRRRT